MMYYTTSRMTWHNKAEHMSIGGGSHEHVTTKFLGGGADGARGAKGGVNNSTNHFVTKETTLISQ